MEELFNDIQRHIAENLPALSLVDENFGQLQTDEDTYPVTFPCVLIDAPAVEWENLNNRAQRGQCTLTVTLVIDCYDDTHYGSRTEGKIAERQRLASELNGLLHLQKPQGATGPMMRKKSRNYNLPGGVKAYEMVYEVMVIESIIQTV